MNLTQKIWGTTECLLATAGVELHLLHIKPEHHCSWHRHRAKRNGFFVKSGRLIIDIEERGAHGAEIELLASTFLTVAPGTWHRFRTGAEPAIVIEVYYQEPLGEDIERRDEGGPN